MSGAWSQALCAAEQTPPHRNRAVDFLRAAAIIVVVLGHWLVSVPYLSDGQLQFTRLLVNQPWTQYVTWVVQVMPIFFFVGGYSNSASWEAAHLDPARRRAWQATRLRRLLLPIAPLVLVWAAVAPVGRFTGLDADLARDVSRAALIPIWFLAVYVLVTVATPASHAAWRRWGPRTVGALIAAAILIDLIGFAGAGWARWANYAFVWLAMHQMGYWWRDGIGWRFASLALVATGVTWLLLLVGPVGYPVAMISVPGAEISNSRPPTVAMLAIGFIQTGLILAAADRLSDWLKPARRWAAVILLNRRIMTIYLWHLTALLIVVGLCLLADGFGLRLEPGAAAWWATRPLWIAAMALALAPLVLACGRFEDGSRATLGAPPGPARAILGALLACAGLTLLALEGAAGAAMGVNAAPVALCLAGIALATISARRT